MRGRHRPITDAQGFAACGYYGVWMVALRGWDERRAGRTLARLYDEHGSAVFAFALHLCGSREDAEDVVQTAYLHAFRALSAGEQLVNPRAWLMVAVRRQVYNLWRGRRETALAELPEAPVEDSDREALAELRRVRMVLFSLPEAQHQAFVLRHWSGLSNREIARALETSESAVETLLVRARAAILASGDNVEDACAGVRDRLALAATPSQLDLAHIARCRGCSRAQARLARITAAAALVALVPRAHVAQALAATVPGFKTGVTAWLAAGKASAAKLVVAGVVSAGTIAVTAPVAAHALHQRSITPLPRTPSSTSRLRAGMRWPRRTVPLVRRWSRGPRPQPTQTPAPITAPTPAMPGAGRVLATARPRTRAAPARAATRPARKTATQAATPRPQVTRRREATRRATAAARTAAARIKARRRARQALTATVSNRAPFGGNPVRQRRVPACRVTYS